MAYTLTAEEVIAIAPELSDVGTNTWNEVLADAALEVTSIGHLVDARAKRAAKYLAAHLATLSKRGGVGGPVTAERVGDLSVSYAASIADGAAQLGSTVYGLEYQRLCKLSGHGLAVL